MLFHCSESPTLQAADAKLSVIEVENMIRERIQKRPEQLLAVKTLTKGSPRVKEWLTGKKIGQS